MYDAKFTVDPHCMKICTKVVNSLSASANVWNSKRIFNITAMFSNIIRTTVFPVPALFSPCRIPCVPTGHIGNNPTGWDLSVWSIQNKKKRTRTTRTWCILFCRQPASCVAAPWLQISEPQTSRMQPAVCLLKCNWAVVRGRQNQACSLWQLTSMFVLLQSFSGTPIMKLSFFHYYVEFIQLFGYIPSYLICTSCRPPA